MNAQQIMGGAEVRLFIVGTHHAIQCGTLRPAQHDFAATLTELCRSNGVIRVAEEMSPHGLSEQRVSETVGAQVARDIGAAYEMLDFDRDERQALGLIRPNATASLLFPHGSVDDGYRGYAASMDALCDEIRERCWVARLLARAVWPAAFVCGSSHAVPLHRLFCSLGLRAHVVHHDFGGS
jgi:hypothetical protein